MTRYVCIHCNAGGGDGEPYANPTKAFYNCHVCKKPNAMLPAALLDTYGEAFVAKDLEIDQLKQRVKKLEERCHPSKVIMIGERGHYVSQAVFNEITQLRKEQE